MTEHVTLLCFWDLDSLLSASGLAGCFGWAGLLLPEGPRAAEVEAWEAEDGAGAALSERGLVILHG